ncbi:MAG TPA: hypothetical protein VL069_08815 [Opitutus sp.]|nr:hypothetical protein [Opitutus sp.]
MGFFDRSSEKKPANPPVSAPGSSNADTVASGVMSRLVAARERVEDKDLPGALGIYEEVLAVAGDRADVLVTISADLGVNGHVREIIELIAPRYDAERHGPATGLNLLQAYLAERNATAAQHVLDILFSLKRPELEDRLFGFSNAIAEMIHSGRNASQGVAGSHLAPPEDLKVNLVSISKPIWFYGLESLAEKVLPAKSARLRRVAFAQLSVLGLPDAMETAKKPEEELGRLSRALPLWFAETFYFSPLYAPIAAVGLQGSHYALFGSEWTMENLRQLVESTQGGLDYIFTGALRQVSGDCELVLRVWEVKKFRERKQFTARWAPATADAELTKLHEQIRLFMEWAPEKTGLPYVAPAAPRQWLDTLGLSVSLFLAEKNLLSQQQLAQVNEILARAAAAANTSEAASLAYLTLRNRAERLSLASRLEAALSQSPLIAEAQQIG